MQLFYRELGEGHPLIILHGLFGSSDNWLSQAKILAEHYKVYLLDARNHGQSPHSEKHNYTVMSNDLLAFMESHHISNPYIIGHSMGGKTVMKFLSLYPAIISKAIIADISPRFYNRHHDHILTGLNAIPVQKLTSRQEADDILSKHIENLGERQFLLKNLYRTPEGSFQWRMNLNVLEKEINNIGEGLEESILIDTPTLFINGGASRYVEEKDIALIKRIFSKASFFTIPNVGHWLHAENPTEFIKQARLFFDS